MDIYYKGETISAGGSVNVRDMLLSTTWKTNFGENYKLFAPALGSRQTMGKYLYIGGDSLHAYAGGDGSSTDGFVTTYNKYLGMNVTQNGYAGSTWTGTTGGGAIKRVTDLVSAGKAYDVVILAWGTNADSDIGTVDDEASAEPTTTASAMKYVVDQIRTNFPKTAIGGIVPPPATSETAMNERCNLIKSVYEKLHVPYVDARDFISLSDLLSDATHLGENGARKYGAAEAYLIQMICPYGDTISN